MFTDLQCSYNTAAGFLLVQFFLFDFQLQHNGIKLHVQIVGSLQFPFIVLPDIQGVPWGKWNSYISSHLSPLCIDVIVSDGPRCVALFLLPALRLF